MMNKTRTITYTGEESGRKFLPIPFRSPFRKFREEMENFIPGAEEEKKLRELAAVESPYSRSESLANYLSESRKPWSEMLAIASMASRGDSAGIRLMYSALFVIPPLDVLVAGLVNFRNLIKVMDRITAKEERNASLEEKEIWFKKKVMMISLSQRLPGGGVAENNRLWEEWPDGVRRALADPDTRWNKAVRERAKIELEALDQRLKNLIASIDPDLHGKGFIYLKSQLDEVMWKLQVINVNEEEDGDVLSIRRILGNRWDLIEEEFSRLEWGEMVMRIFKNQSSKLHSQPDLRVGTSLVDAINNHPELGGRGGDSDFLGALALFVEHGGDGVMEFIIPRGKKIPSLAKLPGMNAEDEMLSVELGKIQSDMLVNIDETPAEIDWVEAASGGYSASYRSMVLSSMDNETFLMHILNNPKAVAKAGVVSLISMKCRSSRVLSVICNTRSLYTGIQNKDVPLNLILNPARIPVNSLRKFMHVRYIDRITLQKLAKSRGKIREEVRREIDLYLSSR
jgi:hypothetical protein